jgi:hypothetical protein
LGTGISSITASGTAATTSVGSINNMSIGLSTPAKAKFTEVTVDTGIDVTGDITVTGNVLISNEPTLPSHSTRKDYVDNKISALAIVFGA